MYRLFLFFCCGILNLTLAHAAEIPMNEVSQAIQIKVEKFQLPNGLTVLLHEDHSAPIVTYHQWFRVGSRNEKVGRTGLAHFFEHLMFKGTQKYSSEVLDRIIQANGGNTNAFTSKDYTGYYINLPSDKLQLAVEIEADRMRNLLFEQSQINSEREVVKEERRYRVENDIGGILDEVVFSTVFKAHPYRWPVVGYMPDLNAASMDELKEFYRVHYAPNNAVIVVVGAFNSAKVRQMIEKFYAEIPAQKLPDGKSIKEPVQTAQREQILRKDVQNPTVAMAYRISAAGEPDSYALDLLSNILSNGTSSRLYKRMLLKEQVVTNVSSYAYTPKEPGIFQVTASVKPGVSPERVLSSLQSELSKLRAQLVSPKELEKAKNQVMVDYVNALKTVSGKARALAANEILFGDYTEIFRDLERYNKVSAEEIKAVAERYLKPEARSTIQILPRTFATSATEGSEK